MQGFKSFSVGIFDFDIFVYLGRRRQQDYGAKKVAAHSYLPLTLDLPLDVRLNKKTTY
jgi:hypothetical protein